MITSSVLELHAPLLIVHLNVTALPAVNPVTVVVGLPAAVSVQLPAIILHPPVPVVGVLPDNWLVLTLHRFWSTPASEVVGGLAMFKVTSSVVVTQPPLLIVHLKVVLPPTVNPVTVVLGELILVIVPVPLTTLQVPTPLVAVLPDKVAVVVLHRFWSVPALAAVEGKAMFIVTSSVLVLHAPLLIVQRNTVLLPAVIPVTVVVGLLAVAIVHVPLTILHATLPLTAALPDN